MQSNSNNNILSLKKILTIVQFLPSFHFYFGKKKIYVTFHIVFKTYFIFYRITSQLTRNISENCKEFLNMSIKKYVSLSNVMQFKTVKEKKDFLDAMKRETKKN